VNLIVHKVLTEKDKLVIEITVLEILKALATELKYLSYNGN
jgi:hypothetical protein